MVQQNIPVAAQKIIKGYEEFGNILLSASNERSKEMVLEAMNKKNEF